MQSKLYTVTNLTNESMRFREHGRWVFIPPKGKYITAYPPVKNHIFDVEEVVEKSFKNEEKELKKEEKFVKNAKKEVV